MSYDLRDLESEVRRLADAIGSMVRQIEIERRERAVDVAACRVTMERIATAGETLAHRHASPDYFYLMTR